MNRQRAVWLRLFGAFVCVLTLAGASGPTAPIYDRLARERVVVTPDMAKPDYLQPTEDPVFGTSFTRITEVGSQLLADTRCGPEHCTHRYSSSQAWNADQSLLVIANGCAGACFLDGKTYKPLFHRPIPNECEWHPQDPALMICMAENEIYTWAPRTNARTTIYTGRGYRHFAFGPYKGNPSLDGRMIVVRATDRRGRLVAFAYDIAAKLKYPNIRLAGLAGANVYCTISPSGNYILCFQEMPDGTNASYVFTRRGVPVQHWTENHRPGHGDMTIDADGDDVYVGVSKSDPDKYHIIKRRLKDGRVTDLAPFGEGQHVSMRSINRPGWAFITYSGNSAEAAQHPDWAPFYAEIIALRIDGSGEMRRIVQTRSAKHDYWSEAQGSPSPDGSRIIWSSNWGKAGGPVEDYVARIDWPDSPAKSGRSGVAARTGNHRGTSAAFSARN